MRDGTINRKPLLALLLLGPVLAGCNGASDLLSKDAQWFSRTGRLSISNVSIETPPLTPNAPVAPRSGQRRRRLLGNGAAVFWPAPMPWPMAAAGAPPPDGHRHRGARPHRMRRRAWYRRAAKCQFVQRYRAAIVSPS